MKRSDIKADRYYQSKRTGQIRYVWKVPLVSKGERRTYYVYWKDVKLPPSTSLKDWTAQTLASFARWDAQEVVPQFTTVERCPSCDSIDTRREGTSLSCNTCYTITVTG